MGRAAKLKQLRKLARTLPEIHTKHVIGEKLSGKDLVGEKDGAGNDIDPSLAYRRKVLAEVNLNHDRKLKQAYNKAGMKGAAMYANAVNNYVQSRQPKTV